MVVFGDGSFATGGYATDFLEDWLDHRVSAGEIVAHADGTLGFTSAAIERILRELGPVPIGSELTDVSRRRHLTPRPRERLNS